MQFKLITNLINDKFLLSLFFSVVGQVLIYYFKLPVYAIIFFGISIFYIMQYHARFNRPGYKLPAISLKTELFLFVLILLMSAILRFFLIDLIPAGCYIDEADNGVNAASLMKTGSLENVDLPLFYPHNPTSYLYMAAAVFKILGVGITQLRITSGIIGVVTVAAIYFLIRILMGPILALAGAFLFSVMRWHITFSRTGFHVILLVAVFAIFSYFIVRAYKKGAFSDFAMCGLLAGFSQYTYVASRLVIIWLLVLLLYLLFKDKKFILNNYRKMLVSLILAVIVYLPLGIYSVQNPAKFFARQEQVSIFTTSAPEYANNRYAGLAGSLIKTTGMFNFIGDNNGRHNLPGEPMLDFFSGTLFPAGLCLTLIMSVEFGYFAVFSSFIIFILSGVLTIESPQALRTLPLSISTVIFITAYIKTFLVWASNRKLPAIQILSCFLALSAFYNVFIYFGPQAHDQRCINEFSMDEYGPANAVYKLGSGWRIIAGQNVIKNPNIYKLIAGTKAPDPEIFQVKNPLPFDQANASDTAYIIEKEYVSLSDAIMSIFPNSKKYIYRDALTDKQLWFMVITIPKNDILSWLQVKDAHGLTGKYFSGVSSYGKPLYSEIAYIPAFVWNVYPVHTPAFATWSGKLKIDASGNYVFMLQSREHSELFIDNKQIIENIGLNNAELSTVSTYGQIYLNQGYHSIKITHTAKYSFYQLFLWWKTPGAIKKELVPPTNLFIK